MKPAKVVWQSFIPEKDKECTYERKLGTAVITLADIRDDAGAGDQMSRYYNWAPQLPMLLHC